jgi:hypothetical protein
MSTSVLPQLLEVNSELSAQATVLEAKLSELQQKRKGIQTVISMFESGEPSAAEAAVIVAAPTTTKTATKKTVAGETTAKRTTAKRTTGKRTASKQTASMRKAAKSAGKSATQSTTEAIKPKTTRTAKVKAAGKASTKTASKQTQAKSGKAAAKRSGGRTVDWQRYLQGTYKKSPLPDVIVGVLQAQPDNVFKIADVMNVVFKEDMPKSHFLKARNRISNILSAGARDGVWHRGRGGTYSMSEKAITAS